MILVSPRSNGAVIRRTDRIVRDRGNSARRAVWLGAASGGIDA